MNKLEEYFRNNTGHKIMKWQHYFDIYHQYFSKYIGTDVHVLEIGIFQGGSLGMWRSYFGDNAKIYAVDINPDCKNLRQMV